MLLMQFENGAFYRMSEDNMIVVLKPAGHQNVLFWMRGNDHGESEEGDDDREKKTWCVYMFLCSFCVHMAAFECDPALYVILETHGTANLYFSAS